MKSIEELLDKVRRHFSKMYYSYRSTDPYSSEHKLYRDYRTGKDHYRHSNDYRSSKDYTPRRSRAFDCCVPPQPPPKDYEYDFLPTFGSYIHEAGSRGRSRDCQCDCCPHTYQGARRVSEGRYKSSHYEPDAASYGRSSSRTRRRSSTYDREPRYDQRYSQEPPRSKRSGKPYEIKVINQTNGALFREQKPEFYIAFDRDTTTRDVLKLLVGDTKKYRVVVHWDDGVEDRLTQQDSWRDVRKYAKYLRLEETKKKKAKHVHWADQTY